MAHQPTLVTTIPPAEQIPLHAIDAGQMLFPMTFHPDLAALKASLAAVGLFNPVILRRTTHYQMVTGYRRVLAARLLGWNTIAARVYCSEDLSMETGFNLAFHENLGTRAFNLIESSLIVRGFLAHTSRNEAQVRDEILPLIGFQPAKSIFQQLLSLGQLLDEWKVFIIQKGVALPNAAHISTFSPEEQHILSDHIFPLKLGHNKLRQCLEIIEEICRRDKLSLKDLFCAEPFGLLRDNGILNSTQRTDLFRRALWERRYPHFTRTERAFQEERKKLSLPPTVGLHHPEFFEGNHLTVRFKFRSIPELMSILAALRTTAERDTLKRLLEML